MIALATQEPTVLFADDDPDQRGLYADYFRGHGYHVRLADSDRMARCLARRLPVSVIVTEVCGPDVATALARLREVAPHVPVVVVTRDASVAQSVGAPDAFRVMRKPVKMRRLRAVIDSAFGVHQES